MGYKIGQQSKKNGSVPRNTEPSEPRSGGGSTERGVTVTQIIPAIGLPLQLNSASARLTATATGAQRWARQVTYRVAAQVTAWDRNGRRAQGCRATARKSDRPLRCRHGSNGHERETAKG